MDKTIIPLVSVIMPAYNAAKYISNAIESVQNQTFTNWELIVVDDGSTDSTAAIVKTMLQADNRIKYYYQSNKKQAAARNTGIRMAAGHWLAFLDADDLWMPGKLQQQLEAADKSNADVIFSSGYYLTGEGRPPEPYDSLTGKFSGIDLFLKLFHHNYIPTLSVIQKKSLVTLVGFQDESLHGCEDWDYWLRCCRRDAVFFGMEQRLFQYRFNGTGTSGNKLLMHMTGCDVLFKNYDETVFSGEERKKARVTLNNKVRVVTNQFFSSGDIDKVLYYLQQLSRVNSKKFKYIAAYMLIKIFKQKSRRLINFIIYR